MKKSVILMVQDSLRADHLSLHGYGRRTSPTIDALGKESVVFNRAFAPATWTFGSVAALFTSRYYSELTAAGQLDMAQHRIMPSVPTMASTLRDAGWNTAAVVANPWITHYDEGFLYYKNVCPRPFLRKARDKLMARGLIRPTKSYATDVHDVALKWLRDRSDDRPIFLYLHYMDTHMPYLPRPPYDRLFASPYDGTNVRYGAIRDSTGNIVPSKEGFTRRDLDYLVSLYDGSIREFDELLGDFLGQLESKDVDEPILIFTSDHGEQFMERGRWGHNRTSQVEELHVPLIMRVPGATPKKVDLPVTLLDLFPTLVRLLGVPSPAGLAGESLHDSITDEDKAAVGDRHVFAEGAHGSKSVRNSSHAYYLYPTVEDVCPGQDFNARRLFDVRKDFRETRDILKGNPRVADALHEKLVQAFDMSADPVTPEVDDPALRQRLKDLGYL